MKRKVFKIICCDIFKTILFISIIMLFCCFDFYLNNIPINMIFDLILLGIPIILFYIFLKCYFDINKFFKLEKIKHYSKDKKLPFATNFIEKKYQTIIKINYKKNNEDISELKLKEKKLHDQYITWLHNIKLPITALQLIVSNSEDLNNDEFNKINEQLTIIKQYLNEMLNLISLNNGNNDLKIEKVDTKKIINEIIKKYSWLMISKSQSISISKKLPNFVSDKRWLEIMLEQIIINAMKYTSKNGRISVYSENNMLVISDNGIGIDLKDMSRIFENGFTGQTGRDKIDATGLGLYLVGQIADMLSLRVKVKSKKFQGTKFYIYSKDLK
ncbi:sensor histidine kinase [Ligilactobacillus cholophilus]|uniref:sensor histidine kinase n=1 Tax=Ligilactobacillus cholophilus TaxID=3050131 RepID=UPI0025B0C775|nr:sensor histidine kinase [Ligilactobacillus cholophilus]